MNKKEFYNKTNPTNKIEELDDVDQVKSTDYIEDLKKPKNVCNTEFKVMPGKSSKLCLMDPIILSWIVSLIAVIIYIIGIKYKPKDI